MHKKKTNTLKIIPTIFLTLLLITTTIPYVKTLPNQEKTITINEIMYDPEGSDTGHEWIEIHNQDYSSIDITGWKLYEGGINHSLSTYQGGMIIPSDGYAVIADNPTTFLIKYPTYTGILIDSAFSLSQTGEYLAITNGIHIIDEITYIPQPDASGTGKSLEYKQQDLWGPSKNIGGTPGAPNSIRPVMKITKTIWDGETWVSNINTEIHQILRFNITIKNDGDDDYTLYNMIIQDILPDTLIYHHNATLNNNLREADTINENMITWIVPASELFIRKGEQASLEFDTYVNKTGPGTNLVNVTSEYCDPDILYIYGEDSATAYSDGGVRIWKTVRSDIQPFSQEIHALKNENITFKLIAANYKNTTLDLHINDTLPTGLTYTGGSATVNDIPMEPTIAGNNYYWNISSIEPGENLVILFNATTNTYGEHTNNAHLTVPCYPYSDTDYATVIIPRLTLNKTIWNPHTSTWDKYYITSENKTLRFNITLTYHVDAILTDITIRDILPENIVYAHNATHPEQGYNPENNTIWWYFTALTQHQSIHLEFDANITTHGSTENTASLQAYECGTPTPITAEDKIPITITCVKKFNATIPGPYEGIAGEPVQLVAEITGGLPPYQCNWDCTQNGLYNDAFGQNTTYIWTTPGIYPLSLQVIDSAWNDVYAQTTVTIQSDENNSPAQPTDPQPEHEAQNINITPTLSVYIYDYDNDTLNVTFYNDADDSIIGTQNNVPSGQRAETVWQTLDYNSTYHWYATAHDGYISTQSETWMFTTTPNHAPNPPTNPYPANNSQNEKPPITLKVKVTDQDDDEMTVYFYDAHTDTLIGTDEQVTNGTYAEIAWLELSYDTNYSWYAVADDSKLQTQSATWNFHTEKDPNETPSITLITPALNSFYFRNQRVFEIPNIIIIGYIDITVQATDNKGIQQVDFYIDGLHEATVTTASETNMYTWRWNKRTFLGHTLKVIAVDTDNNTAQYTKSVIIFNFKVLPALRT